MFLRSLLLLATMAAGTSAAGQSLQLDQVNKALSNKDLEYLGEKVRAESFPCRRAEKGVFLGENQRGRRFRITCDDGKFTYRIE